MIFLVVHSFGGTKPGPAPQSMWSWPFQRKRMNGTEWRRMKRMGGLRGLRLGWWRKALTWRVWWTDDTIQGSDEFRSKQGHLSGNLTHLRGFKHLKPALQAVLEILPQHVVRSSMICWILIGAGLFSWRSTWRGKSQQNFQNAVTVVLNDSIEWNIKKANVFFVIRINFCQLQVSVLSTSNCFVGRRGWQRSQCSCRFEPGNLVSPQSSRFARRIFTPTCGDLLKTFYL